MNPILKTENLVKRYGDYLALDHINLAIPKGSIFGLLGPNGAGKTSLIRIITQITAPDTGRVYFENEHLNSNHIGRIGYLPEERGLYKKGKIGEQLLYLAQLKGMSRADALARAKDWFIRLDIKSWWDKPLEELSKGMAQKVQFVATVLHEPDFIILDEPFSGFDPVNSDVIRDEILRLHANGATILFSTHRMDTVEELCTHVVLINKAQKLLDGETETIRSQFKTNQFSVITEQPIPVEAIRWQAEKNNLPGPGGFHSAFSLPDGKQPNELLSAIMQHSQVLGFREETPSFHDIFVRVVTQSEAIA